MCSAFEPFLMLSGTAARTLCRASEPRTNGTNVTGHDLLAPEAFCNCACFGAENFAYCQNTAHTTVGIATYAFSPFEQRWEARALRYFRAGSPGVEAGRIATNFVEDAILPEGPGGAICEDRSPTTCLSCWVTCCLTTRLPSPRSCAVRSSSLPLPFQSSPKLHGVPWACVLRTGPRGVVVHS